MEYKKSHHSVFTASTGLRKWDKRNTGQGLVELVTVDMSMNLSKIIYRINEWYSCPKLQNFPIGKPFFGGRRNFVVAT